MSEHVIDIRQLSIKFGDHLALDKIKVQIESGDFVAIVGPNGAGKSTLFKVLLGLLQPTEGQVRIFDEPAYRAPAQWIGYVPQMKTLDRSFPAQAVELVLTGLNRRWPWRKEKSEYKKAIEALEQVSAEHLATRPVGRLSGGELQRVCLARSIVRQPKIVLLDEPATGIDAIGEADMYRLLEAYQKQSSATILMITHDWHAATHHADNVLLLNRKKISYGPPSVSLAEDNLRLAFGHIGHKHELKFLMK